MPFDCVLNAWNAHEHEIRGYLLHRLGGADAADDVLHEVFLKAMRQGARFCQIDNPRAWLFQVARNALADIARLTKPTVELSETLAKPDTTRDPVDALDACLLRTLSEMPDEQRDIIEQCDLQGVKQQIFADTHGLSLSATKSRLLRARQCLREALIRNCQVRFDNSGRVCCHAPRQRDA